LEKRGVQPLTAKEFDRFLEEPTAWPADDNFEEFLAWLRRSRRKGRY
jgi:hypothetical protein